MSYYEIAGDEVGFGFLKKAFKSVKKAASGVASVAKSVVRSPITKAVLGGTAIVFPAVGVPALAAATIADKAIATAEKGDAAAKKVKAAIKHTKQLASSGDPGAKRAMASFRVALRAKRSGTTAKALVQKRLATRQLSPALGAPAMRRPTLKAAPRATAFPGILVADGKRIRGLFRPDPKGAAGFLVTPRNQIVKGKFVRIGA